MRTQRSTTAALLGITVVASLAAAGPDDAAAVDVSNATASVSGTTVTVAGTLDFGGRFDAGSDVSDPNQQGKLPATNLTAASVTQDGFILSFDLDIDNMAPADPFTAGEVLQYGWEIYDGNDNPVSLSGWRTAIAQTLSTDGYFAINTCAPDADTGQNTCTAADTNGAFTADGVTWNVHVNSIGGAGKTLELAGEAPAYITAGASGLVWLSGGGSFDLDNLRPFGAFTIGGKVTATVTDAAGKVIASASKNQSKPGAFTFGLTLPTGTSTGEYTVTLSSRYADLVDTETTTITLG